MKKIALSTIYKEYLNNKIFDQNNCKIGQNLLLPGIRLKENLLTEGYLLETIDKINIFEAEYLIFQDIPDYTYKNLRNIKQILKYIILNRKYDFFQKAINSNLTDKMFLIIFEPPSVNEVAHNKYMHKYFKKILTWNDDLIDNKKYFKINYPQPVPEKKYYKSFSEKKLITLIASNKSTNYEDELYSEREDIVKYFENSNIEFDLYGVGWQQYKNYRGFVDDKLYTLSEYKFSICFENVKNLNGYITEKIFDCFFANCIPIYWGANNITEYVPKETFIDFREFNSIEDVVKYIENMSEDDYNKYIKNINNYLNSDRFFEDFSIESYIRNIKNVILS